MKRKKQEDRLDEEIRHHLETEARDLESDGLAPADARHAALRDFGNIARIKETTREVWGWSSLQRLGQDIRYGLRMMRRNPGVSALAIVSLAAGIGANTTVYTIVRAVMSPPVGVPEASRVVNFHGRESGESKLRPVNYQNWLLVRDAGTAFSSMCAWSEASVTISAGGDAEAAQSLLVTREFFETLALKPAAGRFYAGEDEAQTVAVVSHRFWLKHPASLGSAIRVNGHAFTVIGVAPKGFTSPYAIFAPDLYIPLLHKERIKPGSPMDHPGSEYLKITGRLKPEIKRQQAEASLPILPPKSGSNEPRTFVLSPLGEFPDDIRLPLLGAAAFLFMIAGFVLVIACANAGSLQLARAMARRGEIGVRLALGAGRARIVRQLITESVLLFLPAAAAGIGLCYLAVGAIARFEPPVPLPVQLNLAVDYRVMLFTVALALGAGVLFGLAPAAHSMRTAVLPHLKETAIPKRARLRNVFLVCEFSLAFVLVMALGMFVEAAERGGAVYPGKDPSRLYLVNLDMSTLGYPEERRAGIFDRIFRQVRELPAVESSALAEAVPIGWEYMRSGMETLDGSRSFAPDINKVSPGYFQTTGIALLRGRDFTPADRGGAASAVIVNETMARIHWPGQDPIGQRFRRRASRQILEVVGVAADTRQSLYAGPVPLFVYLPAADGSPQSLILHMRVRGDARSTLVAIREIVRRTDPNIPIQNVSTLEERIQFLMLPHRMAASLAGAFGLLGLLLAALGIYGVTAFAVAQRTREIGLRMALGAGPAQIWRTFSVEGTRLIAIALAIAIGLTLGIARVLQDLLYGVPPLNPLMVAAAAIAFAGVWLGGIYLPARRATGIDPSRALRWE